MPFRKNQHELRSQRGTSMPELLMVTVIIAIVAGLALMQFGGSKAQFERQNLAQQLKQAFERARFDSVKRRADGVTPYAKVVVNTGSFTLKTDKNANGVMTDPGESLVTDCAAHNVSMTGNAMTVPVTVSFNRRGEVTATDAGGAVNPVFLICNGTCSFANDNSGNADIVLVTPAGTVNLLPGGSTIPSFTAPTITNVPTGTDIKADVIVP